MIYRWPVSLKIILVSQCSSLVSMSWRVVCIKATVMYHCLTLLLQSPCPLTFNLILKFPHTLGSHSLSIIVTSPTFAWKGNCVLVTGCEAPIVNINLFSLSCHGYCEQLFFVCFFTQFMSLYLIIFLFFRWPSTHHFKHSLWCLCWSTERTLHILRSVRNGFRNQTWQKVVWNRWVRPFSARG